MRVWSNFMNSGLNFAAVAAMVLLCGTAAFAACPVDPNGTYIEAEHYTSDYNLDSNPKRDDKFEAKKDDKANGFRKNTLEAGDNGYADTTPHHHVVQYAVTVPATATYYIWARSRGISTSENSMYFRVAESGDPWKAWEFSYGSSDYTWTKAMRVGADNSITLTTGSTQTIEVAMREKNSVIDALFITTDSSFTPTDTTVPSSVTSMDPRATCAGPMWSLEPATLGPTCFKGYNAASETFSIANDGTVNDGTTATIADDATWLSVDNTTVPTLNVGASHTVTVNYSTATLSAGTYTATITITGNADNSPQTVEVTLIVKDIPSTAACGAIPLYAENLINPAIMVQLDTSGSMSTTVDLGGGEKMSRIAIAEDVLKEVFLDRTIAWGFATWAGGYGRASDSDDAPDYYTNYRVGVHTHNDTHQAALQDKADDGSPNGWTPLVPTMRGGLEYFQSKRTDGYWNETYAAVSCQPRILVIITDGLGNTGTDNDKIDAVVDDLIAEGISIVAVGFGLDNASQLDRIVKKMQTAGEASDDDYLFHLHQEDSNGVAVPFMAQNRQEFIDAMNSVVSNVKAQVFHGSSPAPTTSVDNGAILLNAEFDASDWSGNITATKFNIFTGELESATAWETKDKMPTTINGFIYDATASGAGYVSTYTDSSITGDNFLCKPMGDIINSTPAIVGTPAYYYHFDNYFDFKYDSGVRTRDEIAYVGSNDGALHAFKIKDGSEKWRFYPKTVQTEMAKAASNPQEDMCSSSYCHKFMVDGSPEAADIYVDSSIKWRTILTTGLGEGGSAFFALDVTYGEDFDAANKVISGVSTSVKTKYLWEFTDSNLGYATSWPSIDRVVDANGTSGWATFFGSGEASTSLLQADKEAYLFAVTSWDGSEVWVDASNSAIYSVKLASATLKDDQPSPPLVIDTHNDDYLSDRIYLGNLYGDIYRVKNIGFSETPVSEVLYDSENTDHSSPVTAKAGYAYVGNGNIWLYFGTGKYTEQVDKFTIDQQYFFGLYDEDASKSTAYKKSELVAFETDIIKAYALDEDDNEVDITGDGTVDENDMSQYRTLSCPSSTGSTCNPDNDSWLLKLYIPKDGSGSERVITQPLIVGGIVFFTTFVPDGDVCQGNGDTWLFALDYQTGSFVSNEVFDINGNGEFDSGDTKVKDASGTVQKIGGIYVGTGKPSGELIIYNDILYVGTTNQPPQPIKVNLPAQRTRLKSWQQTFN